MSKRVSGWICETCQAFEEGEPWLCPGCGNETCESCFDQLAHCKICADRLTYEEMLKSANEAGWEFV